MTNKKAIIVNLLGAPGAGKSTGAAYIFSQLKLRGVNAELVTEYAKDKVWEDARAPLENQVYMFAKQWFRITRCEDKVDVIVTDSPLILNLYYGKIDERLGKEFDALVLKIFNQYENLNYFIDRATAYQQAGRLQTEKEADEIALQLKDILKSNDIHVNTRSGDVRSYEGIVKDIINALAVRRLRGCSGEQDRR